MSGSPDEISAFEPVVREIDQLATGFKSVDWLGYMRFSSSPTNHKMPLSDNLTMIGVSATGGNTFKDKISILLHLPMYLTIILHLIKKNNVVYTRGPSVPALLVILFSFFFKNKIFLHKYAGGWDLASVPLSYWIQRWLLKKQKRGHVLVSNTLANDSNYIVPLPNPCLKNEDIQAGFSAMKSKTYSNGILICFAGQCVESKGIFEVLNTLNILADNNMLRGCTIAGYSEENILRTHLNSRANRITTFSGVLSREDLNQVYSDSHFILLPSRSEGFPKVLAEAAAFGCIPIVSNLPGFDKIIKNNVNGILLGKLHSGEIAKKLIVSWSNCRKMKKMANQAHLWSKQFSYDYFVYSIKHLLNRR